MLISIAIPCYRSAGTISHVVNEIRTAFDAHPENDYQLVLVNDGSPDDTFDVIRKLCEQDPKIIGINLSRNYGQACARMAALSYIHGDCVVYMDDDGQHPAEGIFALVDKLQEGYDVVYGKLLHKKHSFFKRATSWINGKIGEWVGNKPKDIIISPFFAMNRLMVEKLRAYKSPFPGMTSYLIKVTERFDNVDIVHRARMSGHSGYTLRKLIRLFLNNITTFSIIPLRIASVFGIFAAMAGFLWGLLLVIRKIIRPHIAAGYTSIIATILLVGGMIMIMLGIIGEYLGRIYMTVSDLPQFTVRETINSGEQSAER